MPGHRDTLAEALRHHRAGRLGKAEDGYRQVLADAPEHADALHFLGLVAHQLGRQQEAIDHMTRSVKQHPTRAEFHNALGAAYAADGRFDEAIRSYHKAVELKPDYAPAMNNLGNVLREQDRLDEAVAAYEQALATRPDYAHAWHNLGIVHRNRGNLQQAEECFRRVLELEPCFAEAHSSLGQLRAHESPVEAIGHYRRALELTPNDPATLIQLGEVLRRTDRLDEAVAVLRRAVALEPELAQAHFHLANTLADSAKPQEAAAGYRRALELNPDCIEAQLNLAAVLRDMGDHGAAEQSCREAADRTPDSAAAHNALAGTLKEADRLDEAAEAALRAVQLDSNLSEAHLNLGIIRQRQGNVDEAVDSFRTVLELEPGHLPAHNNLAVAYQYQQKLDQAAACFRKLQRLQPQQPVWELREVTLWPRVFDSREQLDAHRHQVAAELDRLGALPIRLDLDDASILGGGPPFDLQFDHENVRPLREAYARVFRGGLPKRPLPPRPARPRVGVLVTRGNENLFLRSLGGVLNRLKTDAFELFIAGPAGGIDKLRAGIDHPDIQFLPIAAPLSQAAESIRQAAFDVLYFWEVATDVTNFVLPFLRLAPVQCTSWGIQVTSGIPEMDYYLSSRLVEPPDAQDHYSETLRLASSLLTFQHRVRPPAAPRDRAHFGISADEHVYLCAQQMGKFHPDFDPLLAGILRGDPRGRIVITADRLDEVTERLKRRFARTLGDVADRVLFVPWLDRSDYLSLTILADVLLDPPHFGGVNSTYDGLSFNQPIVTRPSRFHRGRYTAGCFRRMGYEATVAADDQQYIQKAVALGADADYRRTVTEALAEHTGRLFEDHEAVADHQRLFSELVEEARGSGSHAAASPCRDDRPADAAERRESHEPAEPRVAEAPLPSDTTAVEPSEAKARPPKPADSETADTETPDTEPADGQSAETAPRGEERLSRQQIRRRLQAAARCHRDGRRNEAEAHCREVLAASPEEVPALMLLGALCLGDGRASEAVELFSRAQAQSPQDAGLLADLGLAHFTAGDTAAAVRLFRKALKRSPDCFQTHLNLGNALRQQEEFDAAERHCRRALELNPRCAEAHNNLGALFQDQGRTRDAEASFRAAIRQRPTYAQAHFNLAVVLQELGRDEEAERHYRRALKIRPDYVQALNNLGNTLQSLGRLEEAEQSFRQALALAPDHLAAINNLAGVLIDRERVDEALEQLQRAFDVNPESAEAHQVRAEAMQRLQRFDEAIASQREALARSPHTPTFLANMAVSLRTVGDLEQAADVCREAQRLEPENPLWQVREATLWPKVFDDVGHIDRHMQKLEHLLEDVGRRKPHLDPDSLNFSGIEPPFGLQFTAGNLRPLKQRYAAMFEHCFPQEPPPANREKPRIGIFIMEGHEGLLSRSMHGVLRALHGEQFEFVVICSALGIERIKGRMPDLDLTYLPVAGKLSSVARTIRQARLDVLLHREIGTGPITYFLPFFRLAPVQCTTYGIQVTSGISQVDYYLSSAPVEPDDAQDHYAERLLLAETMLPYRRRETRAASGKTRDHFGLAPGDHVYLCAHQLGKFHPDFDPLLNSILTRDPAGRLVITADAFSNAADCLMRRFERTMPACHDRVVMLPRLEVHDYLELIATADVLLDPLHFGGMNTTYDALSFGKPIVTLPSAYHRGRHTLGCYRQIGLLDCVAENAEQYVDTAVALGTDEAYRREVQSELLRASEALFEDNRSIVEHQRLFQGLVDDARSR